jgi:type VI secretion system secreted protein Hcp
MSYPRSIHSLQAVVRPLLAATIIAAAMPALAADQIFLRLDGVPGSATAVNHKDEIDITSYAQAFRNTQNFGFGGGGAAAGRVSCGDITVLKNIDRASPELIMYVTTGRHIRSGAITFVRNGDRPLEYYKVTLREVLVDAVEQVDPPGEGGLTEKVSLKVRQFQFSYKPQNPDGSVGAEITFGWDCVSNTRL